MPVPSHRERFVLATIFVLSLLGTAVGWNMFWFLCDDAYIAFRYVSNSQAGWGYTWNPPPFLPVEGYSSFLWVALLDGVWRITGMEPPQAASVLSLVSALLTVPLVMWLAWCVPLSERLAPYRTAVVALVMLGTLTNRTWLAWTSSGLETPLFTLLVLLWAAIGLSMPISRRTLVALGVAASLLELCRPDGLLFWGMTGLAVGWWLWRQAERVPQDALALVPLVGPLLHVGWRWSTYGALLPNTYYAKQVAAWPQAGSIYLASFLMEYAFFVWAAVALAGTVGALWHARERLAAPSGVRVLVVMGLIGQFAYYTLRVGGDHFEYRVYVHLVPLLWISLPWLWDRLRWRAELALPWMAGMFLLGLVIPWSHWSLTHDRLTRDETRMMRVAVAPHLPSVLHPWTSRFDEAQHWLITRWVGMRHQEHAVYGQHQRERYPSREEGSKLLLGDYNAYVRGGAGYPGWVLPNVIILDQYGLNDFVVARNPKPPEDRRRMAHDREPPPGYHACFKPNVRLGPDKHMVVRRRHRPLTAEAVLACDLKYREGR